MKRTFLISLILSGAAALQAQTSVAPYRPGVTDEGVTYFLPRTSLRVKLVCRRTHHTPGIYAVYAEHFLRLKDVLQTEHDEWTVEQAEIQPYGQADPSQAYTIRLKPKTSAPFVSLAPDGRLLSVNAEAQAPAPLATPGVEAVEKPAVNAADYQSQEILSAGSAAKMAELTAEEIYDIRENRALLAKGQADFMPKDGEQLRLMLSNLDMQEAALLSLFKGTTYEEIHTLVFDVTPTAASRQEYGVARFSKWLGVVDSDDLSGELLQLVIESQEMPSAPTDAEQAAKPKKPVEDLRYIVPGRASASLRLGGKEIASLVFPVAQMGHVEHLGGDLFNKKYSTRVWLSPVTGGIEKIDGDPAP